MLRRHSRSTLFPYTTLFRSLSAVTNVIGVQVSAGLLNRDNLFDDFICHSAQFGKISGLEREARRFGPLDRKSTRLNSSHRTISYAVFCLKKKKSRLVGKSHV